tara:strand:- start:65 stop:325 length:261 start_codon:yes stop_codon:yes gene_type:complete
MVVCMVKNPVLVHDCVLDSLAASLDDARPVPVAQVPFWEQVELCEQVPLEVLGAQPVLDQQGFGQRVAQLADLPLYGFPYREEAGS